MADACLPSGCGMEAASTQTTTRSRLGGFGGVLDGAVVVVVDGWVVVVVGAAVVVVVGCVVVVVGAVVVVVGWIVVVVVVGGLGDPGRAREWEPALTLLAGPSMAFTAADAVSPSWATGPSWPTSLRPQAITLPSPVTARL